MLCSCDEICRSTDDLKPSSVEHRPKTNPQISGQTAFKYPIWGAIVDFLWTKPTPKGSIRASQVMGMRGCVWPRNAYTLCFAMVLPGRKPDFPELKSKSLALLLQGKHMRRSSGQPWASRRKTALQHPKSCSAFVAYFLRYSCAFPALFLRKATFSTQNCHATNKKLQRKLGNNMGVVVQICFGLLDMCLWRFPSDFLTVPSIPQNGLHQNLASPCT